MTVFSDDFNRSDGAVGSDWVTDDMVIQSDAAVASGINGSYAFVAQAADDDQSITVTLGTAGHFILYLFVRADAASSSFPDNHYGASVGYDAGNANWDWSLYSNIDGNTGTINEFVANLDTPVSGDTITLSAVGTTIKLLHNTTTVFSDTSSELTAGTCGFWLGTSAATLSVDAFSLAASSMQTFTPPSFGRIPTTLPVGARGYDPIANALQRNFRARQEGTNVYSLSDGTMTETDPDSFTVFWNKADGSPYVTRVFWGSTADPYELSSAEATALTLAGYTVT